MVSTAVGDETTQDMVDDAGSDIDDPIAGSDPDNARSVPRGEQRVAAAAAAGVKHAQASEAARGNAGLDRKSGFVLVIARVLPVASVLVALSWPVFRRTFAAYSQPKPDVSPIPNPVWPLWFAAMSFLVTRRAGGLFVLGLVIGAILGW